MLNKKIIFVILFLGFFIVPFTFAQDNLTLLNSDNSEITLSEDNSYSSIYFNSSVASDGNGSKENPYKYLNSNRINSNSNLYFADGEYELDKSISISSYNSFIGQSKDNTIIKYTNTNRIFNNNGILGLYNLTLTGGSIYNTKTLTIDNVNFKDSSSQLLGGSINSHIADLTISNSDFYSNSAYLGGAIYSLDSNINISNSIFHDNSANLGGAICDLDSRISMINVTGYNNSAIYQGGAIYKMYGALNLISSRFFNNSADEAEAIWADYLSFNMMHNTFTNNNVYSAVNSQENFDNNTFIQAELIRLDYYNINFEQSNYTQMFYTPYNGTIPSSYDLRNYGLVTPVKNQGNDGNCWAFAVIGALESCILKATGTEYDFSEENMKNLMAMYSDYGWEMNTNDGGKTMMPIGYLTSWLGPVNESDDKYYENTLLSPMIDSIMHVQNIIYLPRSNYLDNNRIKQAILDYGAVVTSIYATGQKYQYYSGSASVNHLVAIVGWDDNFSKDRFSGAKPPANGAWICKNSWGSGWGEKGFFYISYYDTRCASVGVMDASYTFILNDTVKYDKNYQYDVAGLTDYLLTNQNDIWYQNVFNATSDDIIAAFSTYFALDSNFTVEVYVNNELKLTQNGSSPAGYFTFNFNEFIPIYKNDLFKIVLKVSSLIEAQVPISEKVSLTRVHYRPNISFISYDGINWIDLYDYTLNLSSRGHTYDSQVACIKAFTILNLTTTTTLNEVSRYKNNVNLTATVLDEYGHLVNEGFVIFECDGVKYNKSLNNGVATLSLNDLKYKSFNVTAIYENNVHYLSSSANLAFEIPKNYANLTFDIDNIYYGDYFKVNVSLKDLDNNFINSTLLLTIGNKSYNVNSNSVYDVPDLFSSGEYEVSVSFNETDEYYSSKVYGNVTVNRYDVNLSVIGNNIDYGDYLTFKVSLSSNSTLINENVTLNINNLNYSFVANTEFILPIILNASNYDVNVFFNGNERYNSKNTTINVLVSKINPNIHSNINSVKYGENIIVEVNLTGIDDELINDDVVLTLDDKDYIFKANTYYVLPVVLNASNYECNILFNGNNNYNSVNSTVQFVVYKNNLNISLAVLNTTYSEKTIVNTYLADLNGNLVNESVKLEINGVNYAINSNSEFMLPVVLNASDYNASLYFEGDNNYNKCNVSAAFLVSKSSPKLTLDIGNITYGDYLVVRNTLEGNLTYDLILEINNVNYIVQSNSEFVLPVVLDVDSYNASLYFEGDNNYNKCNVSAAFLVSKPIPKLSLDIGNITYGDYLVVRNTLESNLTYDLTLEINNKNYTIKSNSTFNIPDLFDAGIYDVILIFSGDNNYNSTIQQTKVSIDKYTPDLSFNIDDIDYGKYISSNIKLTGLDGSLLNENVTLKINNQNFTFMANDDFIIPILLNASNYRVNVNYKGNNNYNAVNKTVNVNVNKINPKIYSNINSVKYGENIIVEVNLTGIDDELINDDVVLTLDDKDYIFKANTYYVLPVVLNASNYECNILFNGNNNYNSVNSTVQFVVYKNNLNISLAVLNTTYGEKTIVNTYLTDFNGNLVNESVKLEINGVNYTINSNSVFVLPVVLNASSYNASLYFKGNNNYNGCNASAVFLVSKFSPKLTLDIGNITYGDYLVVRNTLEGNLTYDLILEINNVNYTIESNSEFVLPVVLNASSYNASLYFKGNENYNGCNVSAAFLVSKFSPKLTLDIENVTYGDYLVVRNTLEGNLTYDLILEINNKNYTVKSNSTFNIPDLFDAGVYEVILIFSGDNNYNSTIQKIKVSIDKYTPDLSFNIDDVDYGEYISSNIKLTGLDGSLLNENVTLKINNQNYTFIANDDFIIPILLNASNYSVNINYKGNSNYNSVSKTVNVSINKINPRIYSAINAVKFGENIIVEVNLTGLNDELINEDVVLTVDNKYYIFKANTYYILPVVLNASNYECNILFNGNNNYNSVNDAVQFVVYKNDLNISLDVLNTTYGEKTIVNTYLTDFNGNLVNESVKLEINGVNYTINSNSEFVLPVVLNASDYNANLYFEGNDNYNKCNASVAFLVSKSNLKLTLDIGNITYGDYLVVRNTLEGNLTYDLILEINNKNYTVQSNSVFVLPVVLNASDYNANLYFEGNDNYNKCNASVAFLVSKSNLKLTLDIGNITYGDYLVVRNTLEGNLTHDLILEINNKNYTIKSNSTFNIPDLFDAGVYDIILTFNGDNNYNSTIQKTNVLVDKYTPDLSLDIDDIDYGQYISSVIKLIGINDLKLNENVVLTIDSKDYVFMANDDFIIPILLNASNYPVNISFKGNENYNGVNKTVNVNVNKINPKLLLNISDTVHDEDIIINNYLTGFNGENIQETLSLIINNREYYVNSNNDYVLPDKLDLGTYTANLIFEGNSNYNKINASLTFEIYLNELNMDLNISKHVNDINITIKLSEKLNESIDVKINNISYKVETIDGEATLSLNNLELGQYSLEALFNKTSYKPVLIKDEFIIDTIYTLINAIDIEMYYNDGTRLYGRLTDSNNNNLANKKINVYINDVKYSRTTDSNGSFSIGLKLNSGKYLANLEFMGDSVYINSSREIIVNIKPTLDIHNLTKYYRNSSQFYAKILDFNANPVANTQVIMNINGVFYTRTTDSNGVVKLNINLQPDKYILTIYNPITGEESSCIVTVLSRLVENHDLVKYYRNASRYSVKVLDEKGSPLSGVDVKFNINGVFYIRTTDSNGVASLAINLNPGTYIITAEYDSSMVSNTIEVLSTIKAEDMVMKYRDGSKFKALILDGQGNPYPNQSVTFNINGVFYIRMTDSEGFASLNINLMAGKYIITSMFNGLSTSNTITING